MRAILIVPENERAGLTGSPLVSNSGMVSAINGSFQAGKKADLHNMKNISAKLQEAQKAITLANMGLNQTDQMLEVINSYTAEINKEINIRHLVASKYWERWDSNPITNRDEQIRFWATALANDTIRDALLGETIDTGSLRGSGNLNQSVLIPRGNRNLENTTYKTAGAHYTDFRGCPLWITGYTAQIGQVLDSFGAFMYGDIAKHNDIDMSPGARQVVFDIDVLATNLFLDIPNQRKCYDGSSTYETWRNWEGGPYYVTYSGFVFNPAAGDSWQPTKWGVPNDYPGYGPYLDYMVYSQDEGFSANITVDGVTYYGCVVKVIKAGIVVGWPYSVQINGTLDDNTLGLPFIRTGFTPQPVNGRYSYYINPSEYPFAGFPKDYTIAPMFDPMYMFSVGVDTSTIEAYRNPDRNQRNMGMPQRIKFRTLPTTRYVLYTEPVQQSFAAYPGNLLGIKSQLIGGRTINTTYVVKTKVVLSQCIYLSNILMADCSDGRRYVLMERNYVVYLTGSNVGANVKSIEQITFNFNYKGTQGDFFTSDGTSYIHEVFYTTFDGHTVSFRPNLSVSNNVLNGHFINQNVRYDQFTAY